MRPDPPANAPQPADAAGLRQAAEQLERGCRRLAESLKTLAQAAPDQLEEQCAAHLDEARRLRPALSAAASALRGLPKRPAGLSPAELDGLQERVRACVELLRQSADAYGRIIGKASAALAGIDKELRQVHRGGIALRTYRGAVR